jgi:2-polyprenyl-6-methoxyphenol hydroxylase-like FAD-dependent oxidoreductase
VSRLALIAGAGIGGLAAGLALRRAGWNIRIFERTDTPRELGFGLGLAPNAIRALRELGIVSTVLAEAATMGDRAVAEMRRADGRVLRRLIVRREQLPPGDMMAIVLRPVLHTTLLDAVGRDAILSGREVVGFEAADAGVRVRFANGDTTTGDVLIGADGVGSVIRTQLHPTEPPPHPSGYFALRGASPATQLLDGVQFIVYFGRAIEVGVVQASRTTVYWYVSLLKDDVDGGALDPRSVLHRFTSTFDRQFQAITAAASEIRLDELFAREPLKAWGSGPVTLLGDAAHPMLPHTGQGAAQALEDAVELGRALTAPGDPSAALRAYENIRAPKTRKVVKMGPRIARVTTTRNPVLGALRDSAIRLIPERLLLRGMAEAVEKPEAGH